MAAPWRKAAARNNEGTQTEAPCSHKRKAAAKKTVETQTEAPRTYERKAAAKKNEDTQTEVPNQDAGMQFSDCSECQRLALQAFAVLGEGGSDCVRCDRVNYLLSLVVDLNDEVERLRSIKECERKIDWWCQILSAPRSWQPAKALHGECHPLPPCKQMTVEPAGRQCSYCSEPPGLSSSPPKKITTFGIGKYITSDPTTPRRQKCYCSQISLEKYSHHAPKHCTCKHHINTYVVADSIDS